MAFGLLCNIKKAGRCIFTKPAKEGTGRYGHVCGRSRGHSQKHKCQGCGLEWFG